MKALLIGFLAVIWLLCGNGIAYGQSSGGEQQTAYENALLDSLIKYERIKPAYYALQIAYTQQRLENASLSAGMRLQKEAQRLQSQQYERQLAGYRRKLRRSRAVGFVKVVVIGATTAALLAKW